MCHNPIYGRKTVTTVIHILAVAVNYILCKSYLKISLLTLIKSNVSIIFDIAKSKFYFLLLKS
jgi:hypothetical protein